MKKGTLWKFLEQRKYFVFFFFFLYVFKIGFFSFFIFFFWSGDLLYLANSVLYLKKVSLLCVNYTTVYLVP